MIKISFLGDIICQMPFLKAAQNRNSDFYTAFAGLQGILSESDYVVANLETPIAGEDAGYSDELYSFNTPAAFLDGLKKLKIDLYTTANNHCLDRGVEGLKSTVKELEKRGMAYTGTALSSDLPRYFVKQIGDVRCAFLSYTDYVNEDKWNKYGHDLSSCDLNLLIDMDKYIAYRSGLRARTIPFYKLRKFLGGFIPKKWQRGIKDSVGIKVKATVDNEPLGEVKGQALNQVREDIVLARENADIVFLLPHCGGQFNVLPGKLSSELFEALFSFGADAVIGNHPHTIQKCGYDNGRPYAFSLGNVSMSPSYPFQVPESLPEYGMIFHVYVEGKTIVKTSFSIIKAMEDEDHYPMVKPIDELFAIMDSEGKSKIESDLKTIFERIFGQVGENFSIQKEYALTENK